MTNTTETTTIIPEAIDIGTEFKIKSVSQSIDKEKLKKKPPKSTYHKALVPFDVTGTDQNSYRFRVGDIYSDIEMGFINKKTFEAFIKNGNFSKEYLAVDSPEVKRLNEVVKGNVDRALTGVENTYGKLKTSIKKDHRAEYEKIKTRAETMAKREHLRKRLIKSKDIQPFFGKEKDRYWLVSELNTN